MVAVVSGEIGMQANVYFETQTEAVTKRTTLINPIVPEGSITIINKLTGTGIPGIRGTLRIRRMNLLIHVRLMDSAGKTLNWISGIRWYIGGTDQRRRKHYNNR
jgi:hypothetical protein